MKNERDDQMARDMCDKVSELAMRIKWAVNEGQYEDAFHWHQRLETCIGNFYNIPGFDETANYIASVLRKVSDCA